MKLAIILLCTLLYVGLIQTTAVSQQLPVNTLSEEQARAIVQKLYHEKLGHEADREALEFHTKFILQDGRDVEWLATAISNSEEGRLFSRIKRQTRFGVTFIFLGSFGILLLIWFLRKSNRVSWLPAVLYVLWVFVLMETITRLYFTSVLRVDFFHPEDAIHSMLLSQYVASSDQQNPEILQNIEGCRVLLLGGSVLDRNHGEFPHQLRSNLDLLGENNIHVFNFARASHSTRDSRFKYIHLLNNYQFDVVAIYHGINEVRANNCPEDVFKADYSHYAWYEDLNIAERHLKWVRISVIPYVADLFYHRLRQKIVPRRYIPTGEPPPDWIPYGAELKTISSFRKNLEDIIETARSRSAQIILMTFAYYVPPSYIREAYEQHKLDYLGRGYPVELWGEPLNVIKGIEAHNQVIRELAEQYSDVILLDMEKIIPKEGKYFTDICHLSYQYGSKALALPLAELLTKKCR